MRRLEDHIDLSEYTHIVGIDEVGWGALAGPLTVAGVVLPVDAVADIKDSKRYSTDRSRKKAWDKFQAEHNVVKDVWHASVDSINERGHAECLRDLTCVLGYHLMEYMVSLHANPLLVVDGECKFDLPRPNIALPKADGFVPAVSAASVYAKITRDQFMKDIKDLDEWEFFKNRGYGTQHHLTMLKQYGALEGIHRKSSIHNIVG